MLLLILQCMYLFELEFSPDTHPEVGFLDYMATLFFSILRNLHTCVCWSFVCLLWRTICISLLLIFWLSFIFLLLNCVSCLYILEINPLSVVSFRNIFSQSVGCLFVLFMISFAVQKLINLIRFYLFIFAFISITLGDKISVFFQKTKTKDPSRKFRKYREAKMKNHHNPTTQRKTLWNLWPNHLGFLKIYLCLFFKEVIACISFMIFN